MPPHRCCSSTPSKFPAGQTKANCIALLLLPAFPWRNLATGIATPSARGFDKDDLCTGTSATSLHNSVLGTARGTWHLALGNRLATPLTRQLVWEATLMSQREKPFRFLGHLQVHRQVIAKKPPRVLGTVAPPGHCASRLGIRHRRTAEQRSKP